MSTTSIPTFESQVSALADGIKRLQIQLEELEKRAKGPSPAARPFQIGDWAVPKEGVIRGDLSYNTAYQVRKLNGFVWMQVEGSSQLYHYSGFRHATPEEIAAATEIKVGDWVVATDHHYNQGNPITKGAMYKTVQHNVPCDTFQLEGVTSWFLRSRFRKATPSEVKAHLEKVAREEAAKKAADKVVTVTVDGTAYTSGYYTGHVRFGCAVFDNVMIRQAHDLCASTTKQNVHRNRAVTAVQLGRALFTADQLKTLAANLLD